MKRIYFLLFIFSFQIVHAQNVSWLWAKQAECKGALGYGEGNTVALDASENVYFTGYYDYTLIFDTDTFVSNNIGAYLVKYDSSGNLLWAKSSISPGYGVALSYGLATDTFGNAFISGRYFGGSVVFDSIKLDSTIGASEAIFLAKYDSSGNLLWVKTSNDSSFAYCYSVSTDINGNSYITGFFISSSITFGSYTLTNSSHSNVFVVKYDPSGNVLWAKNAGGTVADSGEDESYGIAADPSGNIYITGDFYSPQIIIGTDTLTNSGKYNIFLAKYDSDGNALWAKSAGGATYDWGTAIATNSSNNVYIAGDFGSPLINFASDTLINAGHYNVFLAKYDSSGNVLWAKSSQDSIQIQAWYLTVDINGNPYLSGGQGGSLNHAPIKFDCLSLIIPSIITDPMFFVKFDSFGNAHCGDVLPSGGDDNNGIAVGYSDNIYIGGDFAIDTLILGNDSLFLTNGQETPFLAKFNFICPSIVTVADFQVSQASICADGCINFTDLSSNATAWQWSFAGALDSTSAAQNPQNICYSKAGIYNVTLIASNCGGSDTLSISNYITVNAAPPNPTITQAQDTLFCSTNVSYASYQWYLDSAVITSATDTFLVISKGGNYNVEVTNGNNCKISVGINIVYGIQNYSDDNAISIYPNPATDELLIDGSWKPEDGSLNLTIINILGQTIYTEALNPPKGGSTVPQQAGSVLWRINCKPFPSGIYFLEMQNETGRWVGRFVKE